MPRIVVTLLFLTLSFLRVSAGEYFGNRVLEILGEGKTSSAFQKFRTEFILDKALRNPEFGIKVTASHDSASIILAMSVMSNGYEMNDIKYKEYKGAMPFDINFSDDQESLTRKLGPGKGGQEDSKLKFKKDGITIMVFFKNSSRKKISYIRFSQNIGMQGAYRLEGDHNAPVMLASTSTPYIEPAKVSKIDAARSTATAIPVKPSAKNTNSLPVPASFGKSTTAVDRSSDDPFYNAIMSVIESGEEEMFKDIKKETAPKPNFWNYKYTYSTSVSIPGEKYNMLYSFPFQSSQLDFVSVLEETDGANPAIDAKYAEVEAKLKQYFKQSEGWSYHYTVNTEDPKGIKDLELKNSRLGSIVLDYSINPYGKHVLYLRFLLQYS
jgi:hypothetical protein